MGLLHHDNPAASVTDSFGLYEIKAAKKGLGIFLLRGRDIGMTCQDDALVREIPAFSILQIGSEDLEQNFRKPFRHEHDA